MLLPVMEKEVKKLLDAKIIIPLRYFEWVANLVPVRKKNGEIRLCVDFRNLNRSSKKDNYPLHKMEHILQKVTGATRMSMVDGFSGYNQVSVFLEDREKKTFTTPWGTFTYAKMSFGLMNVGETFGLACNRLSSVYALCYPEVLLKPSLFSLLPFILYKEPLWITPSQSTL
jgi:hypothetical protein